MLSPKTLQELREHKRQAYFLGKYVFTLDGAQYRIRTRLANEIAALYDDAHVKTVILPLIGTVVHHSFPEIHSFPDPQYVNVLQDLLGISLIPARLTPNFEIVYLGIPPVLINTGFEITFHPSQIKDFQRYQDFKPTTHP